MLNFWVRHRPHQSLSQTKMWYYVNFENSLNKLSFTAKKITWYWHFIIAAVSFHLYFIILVVKVSSMKTLRGKFEGFLSQQQPLAKSLLAKNIWSNVKNILQCKSYFRIDLWLWFQLFFYSNVLFLFSAQIMDPLRRYFRVYGLLFLMRQSYKRNFF